MGPKYHLQADVLTLFGCKILVVNLMAAMDPLFRKMCVSVCICMPHRCFHTGFQEFSDSLKPLCVLSGPRASLHLHASRHRDLTTSVSRPSLAGQLWMWVSLLCPTGISSLWVLSTGAYSTPPIFFNSWSVLDLNQAWDDVLSLWGSQKSVSIGGL